MVLSEFLGQGRRPLLDNIIKINTSNGKLFQFIVDVHLLSNLIEHDILEFLLVVVQGAGVVHLTNGVSVLWKLILPIETIFELEHHLLLQFGRLELDLDELFIEYGMYVHRIGQTDIFDNLIIPKDIWPPELKLLPKDVDEVLPIDVAWAARDREK